MMNDVDLQDGWPVSYDSEEAGQSLVLLVLVIVILLAFAGLATDVGMLFARSSQFSSAVDAATLAGVVDLPDGLAAAQQRAEEFLDANRWPVAQTITSTASQSTTPLGYPQLNYTVTYPVETFFLALLGFDDVPISHSASAAVYSWADMPAATQADVGMLRMAGQYLFGPESCTAQGDPISAKWRDSAVPNPLRTEAGGKYTYRIRVPDDFGSDLEVQLFDPDSINLRLGNTDGDLIRSDGMAVPDPPPSCSSSGNGDTCLIPTGEGATANPAWLRRVDESWPAAGGSCPVQDVGSPNGDTATRYELFRLDSEGNRVDLVAFQSGAASDLHTDMRWVTPGVDGNVPAEAGSIGSFRIASGEVSAIPQDADGYRNVYLDVIAMTGASKNGWDVWAGSPADVADAHDLSNDTNGDGIVDGNERNLYILENLTSFSNDGIEIFALGYLPTYSYFNVEQLPLASVTQALGGNTLSVGVFDFDTPADDPFQFRFSSVSIDDWPVEERSALCDGSDDCNNKWVDPPFSLVIPSPETDPPVAFYGGYLTVNYAMNNDEHVWTATLPLGRPFLTR